MKFTRDSAQSGSAHDLLDRFLGSKAVSNNLLAAEDGPNSCEKYGDGAAHSLLCVF